MIRILTDWISTRDNHRKAITVGALVVIVAGIWLFLVIANLVMEHKTTGFDQQVLHALRQSDNLSQPVGPVWLLGVVRDITALGGYTVLTLLTVLASLYLGLQRRFDLLLSTIITIAGGAVASNALKVFFSRERPVHIEHLVDVTTKSFPSGHAMLSTVVYLTLAILLTRTTSQNSLKLFFLCSALLLALLVGTSRLFLGVHFPTDVFAGWIAGMVWVVFCFFCSWLYQCYLGKNRYQ